MDDTVKTVPVMEGLPVEEMDALMRELLGNRETGERVATDRADEGWDKLTLLTGGFVPVGSIFWARPPKTFSQQKILLAMEDAETIREGESAIKAAVRQADAMVDLATELFFVREGGDFRHAVREEVGNDATGLSPVEIKDAFLRLMGMSSETETEGNAASRPTS